MCSDEFFLKRTLSAVAMINYRLVLYRVRSTITADNALNLRLETK